MVTSGSKKPKMVTSKIQTQGFKTAVHKPMGDVTDAMSILCVNTALEDSTACVESSHVTGQPSFRFLLNLKGGHLLIIFHTTTLPTSLMHIHRTHNNMIHARVLQLRTLHFAITVWVFAMTTALSYPIMTFNTHSCVRIWGKCNAGVVIELINSFIKHLVLLIYMHYY